MPAGPYSPEGFRASQLLTKAVEGSLIASLGSPPDIAYYNVGLCHGGASHHTYFADTYFPEGSPWIVKGGEAMNGQLVPPFDPKGQVLGSVESVAPIFFGANLTLTEGKIVAVAEASGIAPEPLIVTPGGAGC
jgi:hypothetical protein